MEEAKAALHGLEGLESEPSQAVRAYDGPRDPDALLAHLGYDGFRPGQREPVEAALAGRDSLVVMPTGGGKSLCYQLPGLASDKLTIVVSPLIALMADQWRRLTRRRPPGGDDRLGPPGGGGARRDGADPRRPGPDRLLLAGALRPARLHERGRPARGRPARRRRGPLHLRVGPRLPPRLPAPAAGARAARPPDGDGLHRDRDRGRLERDRPAPRPPRPADDPRGLRPPQPELRHRPVRGQGIEGAQAGDAAPRPARRGQPPGDRLLRDPQGHRGGRPVPARGRPRAPPATTRAWTPTSAPPPSTAS